MRDLRTQDEILATWQGDPDTPVVSICCITYNHEFYIEDALEGFLIQETDFPFEVLIHDDASTDKTADIIREYERAYPELIKPVYQAENQYSIDRRWYHYLIPKSKGIYIATCEGDDYWTDPKKLQIQVTFLEENPDYVISGHDAVIINQCGQKLKASKLPDRHKRDYSSNELMKGKAWLLTMSWVYRKIVKDYVPERQKVKNGDKFFTAQIGEYGNSKYHDDIKPAAYRVHDGGIWSKYDKNVRMEEHANTYFWLYKYFSRRGMNNIAQGYRNKYFAYVLKLVPFRRLIRECLIRVCFIRKAMGLFHNLKKKQCEAHNSSN